MLALPDVPLVQQPGEQKKWNTGMGNTSRVLTIAFTNELRARITMYPVTNPWPTYNVGSPLYSPQGAVLMFDLTPW